MDYEAIIDRLHREALHELRVMGESRRRGVGQVARYIRSQLIEKHLPKGIVRGGDAEWTPAMQAQVWYSNPEGKGIVWHP